MTMNNSRTDSTGGIYTGTQYGDKTFYGFRFDGSTGDLQVEIIDANDEDPIVIPDTIYPEITDANAYVQHFWSIDAIEFDIDSSGHLRMKFLS